MRRIEIRKKSRVAALFLLSLLLLTGVYCPKAPAQTKSPGKPSPRDKCPVCGMFVAKYPDFLAAIVHTDGSTAWFDGPKDMFKYYLNPAKAQPSRKPSDFAALWVTDYYGLTWTDGRKAFYVTGSNVFGPMGRELIPFEKEAEAKEFLKDHAGKAVLSFKDVTSDALKGLD
jgi:copper chaperone NosL